MQKETIYATLYDELHNEMHRAGIEHPHAGRQPIVDGYGSAESLAIEIEYDEAVALTLFPIQTNHSFYLARKFQIPLPETVAYLVDDRGHTISESRPQARLQEVSVLKIAIERACKAHQWSLNIDDIIIEVRERIAKAEAEVKPLIEAMIPAYKEELAKANAAKAERDAKKAAEQKAQEAAKKAAEQKFAHEAIAWAALHGSERLQKGLAKGYRCKRIFVQELVAHILGSEWVCDWDRDVSTKERSCPSLEALQLCEELEGKDLIGRDWIAEPRVVWLPEGFEELERDACPEDARGFEAVECLVLETYVYKRI